MPRHGKFLYDDFVFNVHSSLKHWGIGKWHSMAFGLWEHNFGICRIDKRVEPNILIKFSTQYCAQ